MLTVFAICAAKKDETAKTTPADEQTAADGTQDAIAATAAQTQRPVRCVSAYAANSTASQTTPATSAMR